MQSLGTEEGIRLWGTADVTLPLQLKRLDHLEEALCTHLELQEETCAGGCGDGSGVGKRTRQGPVP